MDARPRLNFPQGMLAGNDGQKYAASQLTIRVGQNAIITGAAQGIGAETAAILAREGCKVVIADLDAGILPRRLSISGADNGNSKS